MYMDKKFCKANWKNLTVGTWAGGWEEQGNQWVME